MSASTAFSYCRSRNKVQPIPILAGGEGFGSKCNAFLSAEVAAKGNINLRILVYRQAFFTQFNALQGEAGALFGVCAVFLVSDMRRLFRRIALDQADNTER